MIIKHIFILIFLFCSILGYSQNNRVISSDTERYAASAAFVNDSIQITLNTGEVVGADVAEVKAVLGAPSNPATYAIAYDITTSPPTMFVNISGIWTRLIREVPGEFDSDVQAATNSVVLGETYYLSTTNVFGIRGGSEIKRRN